MSELDDACDRAWAALEPTPQDAAAPPFDPDTLEALPAPAARWLRRVLPARSPLVPAVTLGMQGEIALGGRWLRFRAEQVLRAGTGFVWRPVVGGRLLRILGADLLTADDARMDFRLHGVLPVARADGPDTRRSALGRLAAETVAWLPQATTPQAGARWFAVDGERAVVTLAVPGGQVDVTVTVAQDGRLRAVHLARWRPEPEPARLVPFGADVEAEGPGAAGALVAGAGIVGWDHGTADWPSGAFLRFELTRMSATPRRSAA